MSTTPTPDGTASITLLPITSGSTPPNIVDDSFLAAIHAAKAGGTATQSYFDSINQTSDFWNWLTNKNTGGEEPWIPGIDTDGNPIEMSSNGNLDVRMGTFYREPADGSDGHVAETDGEAPPVVGIATIQTHNTTTALSSDISFGMSIVGLPFGIVLTRKLFGDLIKPVYSNLKTYVNGMADSFKASAEVEVPAIDPEVVAEEPLAEADAEIGEVAGELAEEGIEYLAIDWGLAAAEAAGLGLLVAIPLVVDFMGHKMVNSVIINNLTDTDFTWSLMSQKSGQASVLPDPKTNNTIPKMDYNTDSWGDKTTVKVGYQATMQFINSSDLGSIGWVLGLQPADGSPEIAVLTDIPWAGDNIIWTGASTGSADGMWEQYASTPNGKLSADSTVGSYTSSIAISALSGTTDGAYFYGLIVTIEPASPTSN